MYIAVFYLYSFWIHWFVSSLFIVVIVKIYTTRQLMMRSIREPPTSFILEPERISV